MTSFRSMMWNMRSPALVPVGIAIAISVVCAFAGGQQPYTYFQEWQPATVFNFIQLVLCSVVAGSIAYTKWNDKQSVKSAKIFWSIVTASCLFFAADELFQLHESSGPFASMLKSIVGQPNNKYPILGGQELMSFGDFVQLGYILFVSAMAFVFRKEVFSNAGATWMFAVGAVFLVGSEVLDFGMIHGQHILFGPSASESEGIFQMLEETFKLAGFAMILGALMETLMSVRQIRSVEKMLSELNKSEVPAKQLAHL